MSSRFVRGERISAVNQSQQSFTSSSTNRNTNHDYPMPTPHKSPAVHSARHEAGRQSDPQGRNSLSPSSLLFSPNMKLNVDLNCPRGSVFSDIADNVELHTGDGTISFNPDGEAFLNLHEGARMRLRVGSRFISFALENAVARMRDGRLSILAERVCRCDPKADRPKKN